MKLYTSITLMLLLVCSVIQSQNDLVVFSDAGELFNVYIDGVQQNTSPQTNVKITNLTQPLVSVRITFEDKSIKEFAQKIDLSHEESLKKSYQYTYVLAKKKLDYKLDDARRNFNKQGNYKLKFFSEVVIGSEPVVVNPSQKVIVYHTTPIETIGTSEGDISLDVNLNVTGKVNVSDDNTEQTKISSTTKNAEQVNVNNGASCEGAPDDKAFKLELKRVDDQKNNKGKKIVCDNIVKKYVLSANQIASLGSHIVFEGDRLSFAKAAYDKCCDVGNYEKVFNIFSLSSSVEDLNKYVQSHSSTSSSDKVIVTSSTTTVKSSSSNSNVTGCSGQMSSNDFSTAKGSISSKSFEDSKLTVAKQITNSNCLSASQVKEIISLFSFEETKLDFAKFAYDKAFDPQNYYKINDAFKFEASIDELNQYIEGLK